MQTSAEAVYSASSPPFILDSDMSGRLDSDADFEFLNTNLSNEAANSPGVFYAEDFATENSQFVNFNSPAPSAFKSPIPAKASFLDKKAHPISAPSTVSPAGSDSSGYKRKSSSESSRSGITAGDMMMDDSEMGDWKMDDAMGGMAGFNDAPTFNAFDGTIDPASMNNSFSDFNDKSMNDDFDFESAASSPSLFGNTNGPIDMESPEMPTIRHDTPRKHSPAMKSKINRNHNKANSQHSVIQSMNGLTTSASREASPLSAMMTSHESSPAALFSNTPSPVTGTEYVSGTMFGSAPQNRGWAGSFQSHGLPIVQQAVSHPPPPPQPQSQAQPIPRMAPAQASQPKGPYDPVLSVHPTPLKSRVETQIPIKMTLYPFPQGITKLHLPTHTISKPKLLAKPTLERAPDTLELYTTLVCTSAMQSPENRQRAFERAAAPPSKIKEEEKSEGEEEEEKEEDKPLNGGDVKICPGCITRERKRAARKKVKKVEEEESWHKDEAKRVIVFNTHELKDWQDPSHQASPDGSPEPYIPPGAMQVDAPMRIACYCRHQQEKLGFQVIFTIKDYQDRVIAQAMTNSIMITDDHKTHNIPNLSTQNSSGSDGPLYPGPPFPTDGTFDLGPGPVGNMGPFRMSHSTSDLQSMAGNFNLQFPPTLGMATSSHPSQTTSTTMTPRNMSRQTSPSATLGPTSKKRKASGSGKVPTGLAMTRLETGQLSGPGQMVSNPMSAAPSTAASPFTPNLTSFPIPDMQFGQPPSNIPPIPQQYNTGPTTPNSNDQAFLGNNHRSLSMENLAMAHPLFSAPTSTHPSRAPSPNSLRNGGSSYHNQQQNQMPQGANGVFNMPMSMTSPRPPTIHKLIPNEGPRAGGIEVTCLGSGFSQGLEVMFGESKATTTTFWGETSLVCLLPPSAFAGTVPVTFRHQQQQMQPFIQNLPKSQAFFKYVDDDEQQLIRTALAVLGHKMTGKMEDVRDLARRIVGDGNPSWGGSASHSPPGGPGNQQMSGFNAATFGVDLEATLLRCLDLIDLDDSPHMPRLNLRRSSGQTMLHLACSLGLNRVVAALLARGANPEARDKGGFTPMHFAALHNHPQIVRRLMLGGADPTIRSLQGFTPSDMATTEEVLRVARRIEHHSRTRSGSSLKSRTSSATSLRSVWQPLSRPASNDQALSEDSDDGDNEYEDEDADAANDGAFWMRSVRRPSVQQIKKEIVAVKDPVLALPEQAGLASPSAAMTAFRDQVTAQIQALQQTMHLNFPNLPQMPALPDYQNYLGPNAPMVRRISNLVNNRQDPVPGAKEQDYKWWDLFSGTVPAAPPAYEDIFPQGDAETKRETASRAAADAVADNKCAELFDQVEGQAESSTAMQKRPVVLGTVRIGNQHTITREQQDQLRLAYAEKVKRLSRDRNLFFIWIPLLTVVILAMLYNRVPQAWNYVSKATDSMQARADQARFVEV